jgi:hypothetical protein
MAPGIDIPPLDVVESDGALLPVKFDAESFFAPEVVPLLDVPRSVVSVELMLINCSRLFTETSWLTYSLGSVFAVGSWFCNSVTSKVRKSLDEMVAAESLLELPVLLELPFTSGIAILPVAADAEEVAAAAMW